MSRVKPLERRDVPELQPFSAQTEKRMDFLPNQQRIMAYKPKRAQHPAE